MGILDRLRKIGKTDLADSMQARNKKEDTARARTVSQVNQKRDNEDKLREVKKRNEDMLRGTARDRSKSQIVEVADAGTSTREDKEKETGILKYLDKDKETTKPEAPEAPKPTEVTTEAPKPAELPTVSKREERAERREVQDEYAPVFESLAKVGQLAQEGRTAEIDLAKSQANDVIALLDTQLKQFEDIKLRKDISTEELATNERERELVAKDKMLAENALAQAEAQAQYKNQEELRVQYNLEQKVRFETFAGIKSGFGSSARIADLEGVMNDGQRALEGLQTDAINSDARFANEALNIEKDYNLAMGSINANLNAQLLSNDDNLLIATQQIMQNKLLTTQDRDTRIQASIDKYNDKVLENELRVIQTTKEQNTEVTNRITALKQDNYMQYQLKRDEAWKKAEFDMQVEQMGIDAAQASFQNQLNLYSTISSIQAQEKGINIQRDTLAQSIQEHSDAMDNNKKEYDEMVRQFGVDASLKLLQENNATEEAAVLAEIKEFDIKERIKYNEKALVQSEQELIQEQEKLLLESYIEFKEDDKTYFYNPVTQDLKTPKEFAAEAERTKEYTNFDLALKKINWKTDPIYERKSKAALSAYQNGNVEEAKDIILKGAADAIENDILKDVVLAVDGVRKIEKLMNDYQAAGGEMGIWSGSWENIANSLNKTQDVELLNIGNSITSTVQLYRHLMSGAAFSVTEGKEYASLFPSMTGTFEYNQAKVDSLKSVWGGSYQKALEAEIGVVLFDKIFGDDYTEINGIKTHFSEIINK